MKLIYTIIYLSVFLILCEKAIAADYEPPSPTDETTINSNELSSSKVISNEVASETSFDVNAKKNDAIQAFNKQDYKEAINIFNEIIKINKNDFDSIYYRATSYYRIKDFINASIDFLLLLPVQQDDSRAINTINMLGLSKFQLKDFEDSKKYFSIGIERFPNHTIFYANRGLVYMEEGDYNTAILSFSAYLDAEKPTKENSYYYIKRADSYVKINDFKKAIQDYTTAINFQAENYNLYIKRASAYIQTGGINEALNDYAKAQKIYPNSTEALLAIADIYTTLKVYTTAIQVYDMLTKLEPLNSNYYYYKSRAKLANKDATGALADINYAISLSKENNDNTFYLFRAQIYLNLKNYQAAQKDVSK